MQPQKKQTESILTKTMLLIEASKEKMLTVEFKETINRTNRKTNTTLLAISAYQNSAA